MSKAKRCKVETPEQADALRGMEARVWAAAFVATERGSPYYKANDAVTRLRMGAKHEDTRDALGCGDPW